MTGIDLSRATWRKSTYSSQSGNCVEVATNLADLVAVPDSWRKSSYSSQDGNCVEVAANAVGLVAVRDSKHPDGPELLVPATAWRVFVAGVKLG